MSKANANAAVAPSNIIKNDSTVVVIEDDQRIRGTNKVQYLESPDKSYSDKKDYRTIKLPNGLTALLISDLKSIGAFNPDDESDQESDEEDDCSFDEEDDDELEDEDDDFEDKKKTGASNQKEKKMAACALSVNVGSFSDPFEIQGMAHFLEHMVFMGSKKYPQENDFDKFVSNKGGSDNAGTDSEHTTFYFEIQEKYLLPAMDRFAQFFINPLMKKNTITREREAIESEFKMALPSDYNRKEQLFCSCAKINHPATKFSWGNLITLRDNIDEEKLYSELHKFKDKHYSAHRMTLAVQARLSLDDLEKYVTDCFSNVPVNNISADSFSEFVGKDSFNSPNFCKLYKIKPIKDTCQVELTWVMPPLLHMYKSKPHQIVSWIIGHEGEGSLINYLRQKLWCLDIISGNTEGDFEHNSMYALFSLTLILTDDGCEHLKEVLEAVFSYINMLRQNSPEKRIYDEIKQIEEINFRFQDEEDPVDYVEELCANMHLYPPKHYITGDSLFYEYDPKSIKRCIDDLTPDNVNIILFDRKFNEDNFDKLEPWFQTKYACEKIPEEWISRWKEINPFDEFHLPEPSKFITDDFSLIDLPANIPNYPTKIHQDKKTEVWYRADPKFRLPECYIYLYLITPYATESPKSSAMLDIFLSVLKYFVVPELYPASVAELHYEINSCEKGFLLKVYGLNQKLPLLLHTLFENIAKCHKSTTEKIFNVMKREQCKTNFNVFIKPNKLCKDVRLSLFTTGYSTAVEKHAALCDMTFDEYLKFSAHLLDNLYIKCLAQGNITQENLLKCITECTEILSFSALQPSTYPAILVYEIPHGEKYCKVKNFNAKDVNSVVTNYYQSGLDSIEEAVMIELLMLIIEEPVFDILRTKEQLGYNVFCLLRDTFDVLGFSITVCTQANKFTTEHIDSRIEKFIQTMIANLKSMRNKEFDAFKKSLIETKKCVDVNLKEEINRNWSEITHNKYVFNRIEKEIKAIDSIKINELRQWFRNHSVKGNDFKKLSIQIVGTANSLSEDAIKETNESEKTEKEKYSIEFVALEKIDKKESFVTDIAAFKKSLKLLTKRS